MQSEFQAFRRVKADDHAGATADLDSLTELWNLWVRRANVMQQQAERDEYGHLMERSDAEFRAALEKSAQKLRAQYPRLGLPTPAPKTSAVSQVVEGIGISAYYIEPWRETVFTVKTQSTPRYVSVYAHEYSHYCGYHREDEANYLGLLLCLNADDPNIRYSGWLDVRNYIWKAVEQAYFGDRTPDYDDPDFLAFCDSTEAFYDNPQLVGDMTGNYKFYHKERGEENPKDTRRENPGLVSSDRLKLLIGKAGEKRTERTKALLGEHYYDGVVQLMLDHPDMLLPE